MKKWIFSILIINFIFVQGILAMSQSDSFDDFESEFSTPKVKEIFDPLSSYNEFMTGVNDFLYSNLIFPISRGYESVVHENIRVGISNFFTNLTFPINFVNNTLQLKLDRALEELTRFSINTVFGLGGFFDPAEKNFNLKSHQEDFGQTLGYWGVGSGFHIVLPILGNSNLRDSIGLAFDKYIDPTNYWSDRGYNIFNDELASGAFTSFEILNRSSFEYKSYESLKKDAIEIYPFFREIYEQNRDKRIAQ